MVKRSRRGFSLMEMLLATAIFLGCVVVLAELANTGRHHVQAGSELAAAQLLCQSKLNELLAGVTALEPVQAEVFPEHPAWSYSVQLEPQEITGLVTLRVTVFKSKPADLRARSSAASPQEACTLVHWVYQPSSSDEPMQQPETSPSSPSWSPALSPGRFSSRGYRNRG